jgi:pilus assembly protein CpaB
VRRRRAALLLSLALASGGLAAAQVAGRVREVDARVGAPVPVLVVARAVDAGTELDRRDLEVRQVPRRFTPPDALASAQEAIGAPVTSSLARGSYVTASSLAGQSRERTAGALRHGQRAVEVGVSGAALTDAVGPGARVDVLVSTQQHEGAGRSFIALEDVELLDLREGASGAPAERGADDGRPPAATATLRVTVRQAVYLTAAENFAREVRLLPRPPGDRARWGRAAVVASGL